MAASGIPEKPGKTVTTAVAEGVCAPKGFLASGIRCGIQKTEGKTDLALIFCRVPCRAAAVYTSNKVKAAPLLIDMQHLTDGKATGGYSQLRQRECLRAGR